LISGKAISAKFVIVLPYLSEAVTIKPYLAKRVLAIIQSLGRLSVSGPLKQTGQAPPSI